MRVPKAAPGLGRCNPSHGCQVWTPEYYSIKITTSTWKPFKSKFFHNSSVSLRMGMVMQIVSMNGKYSFLSCFNNAAGCGSNSTLVPRNWGCRAVAYKIHLVLCKYGERRRCPKLLTVWRSCSGCYLDTGGKYHEINLCAQFTLSDTCTRFKG